MDDLAKLLIVLGLGIAATGALLFLVSRVTGIPTFPGTFVFETGNLTCLVPIGASILLSIILTVILNLILRAGK
jgi:hypothetical protein